MRPVACSLTLLVLFAFTPALATTWNVPGDVATIQAAVDSAAAGDSVLVACGTYLEHDITLDREITILSATGDPDCVTIDAGGLGRAFISFLATGDAHIEGITVTGGVATAPSGSDGWGGGMLFFGDAPTLVRCAFTGNDATIGGALALTGHGASTIEECTFDHNTAEHGAGLLVLSATTTLTGCTFYANSADSVGGATYANLASVTIDGCTFHGNSGPAGGGALYGELQSDYIVDRTILAASLAGEAVLGDGSGSVTLTCSDVYGNAGGDWVGVIAGQDGANGNFSADPLFCDAGGFDFQLAAGSPCLPGNHPDGASCGTIGAWDECATTGVVVAELASPVLSVSPNPFRSTVRVSWDLPRRGNSRISIYDVSGRALRTFDVNTSSGDVQWDGRNASGRLVAAGAYFVRLDGDEGAETKRVLFVR